MTPPHLEISPPLHHQIGRRESQIHEYLWERSVAMVEVVVVVAVVVVELCMVEGRYEGRV